MKVKDWIITLALLIVGSLLMDNGFNPPLTTFPIPGPSWGEIAAGGALIVMALIYFWRKSKVSCSQK